MSAARSSWSVEAVTAGVYYDHWPGFPFARRSSRGTLRASSQRESNDYQHSLCATLCCRLPLLVAPKGQEKGNISERRPPQNDADPVLAKDRRRRQPPWRPGARCCGITPARSWRPTSSSSRLRRIASCSSWCCSPTIDDASHTSRSPRIRRRRGRPNSFARRFRGTRHVDT